MLRGAAADARNKSSAYDHVSSAWSKGSTSRPARPSRKALRLVDVSSIDLAAAKNDYLTKEVQSKTSSKDSRHAPKTLRGQKPSRSRLWTDAQNDEEKSKLEFQVARDKLKFLGLDDEAIGLVGKEDGARKARLTLRAPVDGTVSKVDAELGNLYDMKSVLLILSTTSSVTVGHALRRKTSGSASRQPI